MDGLGGCRATQGKKGPIHRTAAARCKGKENEPGMSFEPHSDSETKFLSFEPASPQEERVMHIGVCPDA